MTELEQEPVQIQQPDPEQPLEEAVAEPGEAVPAPKEDEALRAGWSEVMPELAEEYEKLSPDARVRILLKRAQRLSAQRPTDAPNGASPDGQAPNVGREQAQPTVPPVEPLDVEGLAASIKQAVDDADGEALAAAFAKGFKYIQGVGNLMLASNREQGQVIREIDEEIRVPGKFRRAMANVRGAKETDLETAQQYYKRGEAKTPEAALKMAVFDRFEIGDEDQPSRPGTPENTRRARAIGQLTGAPRSGGRPVQDVPIGESGYRELLEAEARQTR